MTVTFDPDNWLLSAHRALHSYVQSKFDPNLVTVEMSWPDVTKELPFHKVLIHMEQDDQENPILGFGTPGVEVYDEDAGTWVVHEAQLHHLNFDVGVWASSQAGGATARSKAAQTLTNIFTPAEAKKELQATTDGIWVVSFNGGRNELDRITDLPVWRAMDMTLVVRVVSRHIPAQTEIVPFGADQTPDLTIVNDAGEQSPVT